MRRTISVLAVLFLIAVAMTQPQHDNSDVASRAAAGEYGRETGNQGQGRSIVVARHGIVATSQPLAAQAGLDILKAGGNAVDAAIATNAMLGVVEPMSCGLGGDLFAIYWDNKEKKLYGLNASGRSPYNISQQVFQERGMTQIPTTGPLSWSVPGCVSGWEALTERFGTMDLGRLLAPAIETAEQGFGVTETIGHSWQAAEDELGEWSDSAATFLVNGRAPRFGEVFRNPRLAQSYRAIAEGGADAFYKGSIAEQIVAFSEANGGYFSARDFAEHRADWVEPVSTNYRGYDVWQLPPNGQGIAVLQMLNLLEPYDLRALGSGNPEYLHLFLEAKKLAFADRAKFYADPTMADVPLDELISKEYAEVRGSRIDRNRAADDVLAGDPRLRRGDTIYLTVVDKDRNACSLIQSVYSAFGSKVVPGDVGFPLQNRGALFALDDTHLNRLEPHKRPFHTIIPSMVTQDGRPWFCFGVMGGDLQPQGQVQVLVNLIDFEMNTQMAGDAARVQHAGSATPTGIAAAGVGQALVEPGITDEAIAALRAKGHDVQRGRGFFGGYQGILIDWENGTLQGGSESRLDGAAVGY